MRKPKSYEEEPDTTQLNIGYITTFTPVPRDNKKKKSPQIGFIRQKSKNRLDKHNK